MPPPIIKTSVFLSPLSLGNSLIFKSSSHIDSIKKSPPNYISISVCNKLESYAKKILKK